ncbi:hypothetical protein [Thermogemmatispora tikiterensis]|uniref:Uncharacterized protein n=1 Tax=Thermogemmatispora tikiterensis TaxID=1825093 RepID=A0A328VP30_9CHLR|nr:hypothetical protein [Thermogemmatispora tikiterensis]RAQ97540.1 hypothetical protein A4R35_18530 [Thermogemmatispora tikiterensis]
MEPSKRIEEYRERYDPRQLMRALRESLDERGRLRLLAGAGGYRWEAGFRFGEPASEEELEELEARLTGERCRSYRQAETPVERSTLPGGESFTVY